MNRRRRQQRRRQQRRRRWRHRRPQCRHRQRQNSDSQKSSQKLSKKCKTWKFIACWKNINCAKLLLSSKTVCFEISLRTFNPKISHEKPFSSQLEGGEVVGEKCQAIYLSLRGRGSGCSTAVERMPHNKEVVVSNPSRCRAFFLFSILSEVCL